MGNSPKNLARSADNQALIQAVIGIAGSFEMFCVAQNVETASDAEVLTKLGRGLPAGLPFGRANPNPALASNSCQSGRARLCAHIAASQQIYLAIAANSTGYGIVKEVRKFHTNARRNEAADRAS